jgi:hypothetical protein
MAADSKFFREYPDSQYHEGLMLDEYNGTFSLVSVNKGKDGKVYMKWGYPQKFGEKVPIDKSLPWKVTLGNQEQALKTLRYFVALLGGEPDGDMVPF